MHNKKLPKFLVTRFAPGSAGNFLSSLLQCSKEVGHWSEELENSKPNADWLGYFCNVFTKNLSAWIANEPTLIKNKLGLREIFSAKFDRGNDLSANQFFELEQKYCSEYYFQLREKDLFIPIHWQKNHMPEYLGRCYFVNIILDAESLRWYDRAYYKKSFTIHQRNQDGSLIIGYEIHNPDVGLQGFEDTIPYQHFHKNFVNFARQEIFGHEWRRRYRDTDYLKSVEHGRPEYSICLSDLLDINRLIIKYSELCEFLNIEKLPTETLVNLFDHWRQCHDF